MRRLLVLLFASALVLTACGDDSGGNDLDGVKVSGGKTPAIKSVKDLSVTKTQTRTIKDGDGDKIKSGDAVSLNYIAVNGRTGKEFDNTFKGGSPMTATIKKGAVLNGFVKGLTGKKIGSRLLVAVPPKDGFEGANKQLGIKADDTMIFLFDVVSKVPAKASGTIKKAPASVPKLVLDEEKQPAKFEKTSATAKAPKSMKVHTVIEGDGKEVTSGQTLTIQYIGQIYPDGKVFDESWSRGPATFQIGVGGLIECWDKGLIGQKVGSRVILECPADVAYKKAGNPQAGIKGTDTLLFSVDLLSAF